MARAGGGWESKAVTIGVILVLAVSGALVAVAVKGADDADRRTLAASAVERTTSTTAPGSTPTSLGVAPTTTTTAAPDDRSPTTGVVGALDAGDGLSITGIGPLTVGMTLSEAEEAAGVPLGPPPGSTADDPGAACTYVAAPADDPLVLLMVEDGVVSRIDVTEGSPVKTLSGVGVGATEAEVIDTYGSRIREEPHPYDEDGGQLRYVPDDDTHSLIFETHDGVVTAFRSGFREQVAYAEGCS